MQRIYSSIPWLSLVCCLCPLLLSAQIDSARVHDSPYSVIYNHLFYLQADSYMPERAALSFKADAETGKTLAIQLKQILDGKGLYIDLNRVPARRHYQDSVNRESIYLVDRDNPLIYVEKVDSAWYYSRTTADAIPAIHREMFPLGAWITAYFQAPAWQTGILNIPLWKWLGLLVALSLSALLFRVLRWISHRTVAPFLQRRLELIPEVDKALRRLSRLLAIWLGLHFFRYVLPMLLLPVQTNAFLMKVLGVLIIFFLIFIANEIVRLFFFKLRQVTKHTSNTMDDQFMPILRRLAFFLVWALGLFYALDFLDVNVTALLAGISIGGLAIALAAQDTVKNFFGSIMIFVDKPFQIGDWIQFREVDGVVEEVGFRSTRIRTFANSLTYVPNGMLADQIVDNLGLRVYRRFKTDIGITYDTPPALIDLFVRGIQEVILKHPTTRKDYFEVHLNSFGPSALNILLYTFFKASNWTAELKGRHELMYAIIVLANDLGVRFAFPTQTLHIEEFPGAGLGAGNSKPKQEGDEGLRESLERIGSYFKANNGGKAGKG